MWPVVQHGHRLRARRCSSTAARSPGPEATAGILPEALLTGCASIYHSIRCALALANYLGEPQPEWEVAVGSLGHAIAEHPGVVPRQGQLTRWSGTTRCSAARCAAPPAEARIDARWDDFVVAGSRHPLRRPPAVGDRRGDLRTGDGARRDGRLGPRARAVRRHAPPARDATAPTGPDWCSPTASGGRWSAPRGPGRR